MKTVPGLAGCSGVDRAEPEGTTVFRLLLILGLAAVLPGASAGASFTVRSESLGSFDLSGFTSCSWAEGQPAANFQIETLIRRSVEEQFEAKGLTLVEDGSACRVRTRVIRARSFQIGVLIVEILETESGQVVWRGEASGLTEYPLKKIEKMIVKSVKKMFKEFPRVD
jgi:hypothetical protein